jgi:hypothetical protein
MFVRVGQKEKKKVQKEKRKKKKKYKRNIVKIQRPIQSDIDL